LKFFDRGLFALILTFFFYLTLQADYLYKDDVLYNPDFRHEINILGDELYKKTGISLKVVIVKKLPQNMHIVDYEKEIIKEFKQPTILLTFAELDKKIDILANDRSLYKYFDKKQVLSPVSSFAQALIVSILNFRDIDGFIEGINNYGGTIIPIISLKNKDGKVNGMYSAGIYNGYSDIAEQIATNKGVVLKNSAGNGNRDTITIIKILFYGLILYAIFLFIKRKIYILGHKHEK